MIDGPQEVNVSHGINFHAFLGAGFPASNYLANYASPNAGPDHQAFSILTIQIRHLWFHLPEKVDSLSRGRGVCMEIAVQSVGERNPISLFPLDLPFFPYDVPRLRINYDRRHNPAMKEKYFA
ncbi:uncharacterized protein TrAFT101_000670 [Trichoderma asperellum]|uniref:uncharacterized protein n=1 Tax=Trichoderma asperellum TaxID=101201 RepID=UPI0033180302|nr:hypothetical protein TrAFT101_000670 [Trichoderma asperellum]